MTELWVINVCYQQTKTLRLLFKKQETFSAALSKCEDLQEFYIVDDFGVTLANASSDVLIFGGKLSSFIESDSVYAAEMQTAMASIEQKLKTRAAFLQGGKANQ